MSTSARWPDRLKYAGKVALTYVGWYFAGIAASVVLTPVEAELLGRQLWPFYLLSPVLSYVLFYLFLAPQYVFGSTVGYWAIYALGLALPALGLLAFLRAFPRLRPWQPVLIGFPLGFIGAMGIYYSAAASI